MKKVVEIDQFKMIDPNAVHECSVCALYKPRADFGTPRSRLNCQSCYETPKAQWDVMKEDILKRTPTGDVLRKELFLEENPVHESGIKVEDMIKALQNLPPGSTVVMTQSGYYSEGKFASINLPEKVKDDTYQNIYSIGHSSQNN